MAASRCPRCLLHVFCVCAEIPRVETRTHFLIVRHRGERMKTSNTGRLAHQCLPNSSLHDYGHETTVFPEEVLLQPDTWLLDPYGPAWSRETPPAQVVVLDGSWTQVRRMHRRLSPLHRMPRLSLPAPPPRALRMRIEPDETGMATIEAIAAAVCLWEGQEKAALLEEIFEKVTERVMGLRSR